MDDSVYPEFVKVHVSSYLLWQLHVYSVFLPFAAAERAECCGGGTAPEILQPGGKLHDRAVCLHCGCPQALPQLSDPEPRSDSPGVRRVGIS